MDLPLAVTEAAIDELLELVTPEVLVALAKDQPLREPTRNLGPDPLLLTGSESQPKLSQRISSFIAFAATFIWLA